MKKSIVLLLMLFSLTWLAAQTTGKIKGVVKDDGGDPLPGAFVTIEGTTMGSQTDENGYYYIIGVRAGTYNLKCQFVGFQPAEKKGIAVKVGLTATVDFKMASGDVQLKTVEVYATQDKVEKGKTTSERNIDVGSLETSVQTDVAGVLSNQAGVKKDASGELHFRGGRSNEVSYVIDGVSTGDPTGSGTSTASAVNFANVESFNIQKGVPEADVGNALSGNVNIVMKIGDQKKTSGYAKYSTDAFMGDNKFDYHSGEFSLNGPMPFTEGMKMRPTYYIATDMNMQNGFRYSYKKNGTSDYFSFGDDDLTGFGFDMPIKRDNNFNVTFKTAYDFTEKIKMSATFQKSRSILYGFSNLLKYSPESANKNIEDVISTTLNYKQTINQESYFDLIFSMYSRQYESLPMGKKPDQFITTNLLDGFNGYDDDCNGNGLHDGGSAEGYGDVNHNAIFDREYFVDYNKSGKRESNLSEPFEDKNNNGIVDSGEYIDWNGNSAYDASVSEPFADHNQNGVWDGDILYDSNNNLSWDYWETGEKFNGFESGNFMLSNGQMSGMITGTVLSSVAVEGYTDKNRDGKYNENIYVAASGGILNDTDEAYLDGDQHFETGEPFVDWVRLEWDDNFKRVTYKVDGYYNEGKITSRFHKDSLAKYIPITALDSYMNEVDLGNGVVIKTSWVTKGTDSVLVTYPPEPFVDLPSTYGSPTQDNLRVNQTHDNASGVPVMDEFEAYCKPVYHQTKAINDLGLISDGSVYIWEGSYAIYRGPDPSTLTKTIHEIEPDQYSTWTDRNGNKRYDAPNGSFDASNNEQYVDFNNDGKWNRADLFNNPGSINNPTYSNFDNTVYKLKGNYTNQLDKYNMLTTGFEFVINDLKYQRISGIEELSDPNVTYPGLYPSLGSVRTYYQYVPKEFSFYAKDKMEFEDLVINAGARLDARYMDDAAKSDYEKKKAEKVPGYQEDFKQIILAVSPRFGISHSISETSKLFFSYGHLYQLPNYTQIFDPNDGGSTGSIYGNMNLGYTRNVQYELGVVNEMGDYMLDVTGYFKDIYDMVNTKKYENIVGTTSDVYYNSDYGKSRGIELTLDKALSDKYSWSVSYELSYAYGKSSSATDNAEVTDERDVKIKEYPLDWDERHSLSTNIALVYGADEYLFETPYLNNWSLSMNTSYGSGKPFTPTVEYFERQGIVKAEREIEQNSERLPWTTNTDFRISKSFDFASGEGKEKVSYGKLKFDFDVLNAFDRINVQSVYANTGSWYDPGKVNNVSVLANQPERAEFYKAPANVSERRNYKFSMSYSW